MREGLSVAPFILFPFPPLVSRGIHKSFSFVAKSISAPRLSSLQREQGETSQGITFFRDLSGGGMP